MKSAPSDSDARQLDNSIWRALTTCQSDLAIGNALAVRFHPEISALAAISAEAPENWLALAELAAPGETVMVAADATPQLPDAFSLEGQALLDQMILLVLRDAGDDEMEPLDASDAPEMAALVALTQPGPYAARTHEIGRYYGIRRNGALVAMAGERLHVPGYTEISTVCVHPEHRGQRYAERLIKFAAKQVIARGEVPFLHVAHANAGAIALYEKIGFELRRQCQALTLVRR